jgi:TBC1 domain family protein 5
VYVRLQKVDPALRTHLDKVGIEPQLFLLRWLRVLFSREFHLDDAMLIWDAAIGTNDPSDGDDTSFSLDGDIDYDNPGVMDFIESTAVAMLVFVRVDVLSADDFGSCLRRLQKFPPVEDVLALVERARFASRGKVDADGWIPRAVSSGVAGGASTPSSSGHTVSGHKQTPGSKANEFLAKAKETGGVARERASALIGRAKNAMGVLKLEDDQGGLRYDMGAGEPFGSSAQPELPGVSGELPGVDLGAVDASRRQPPPPVRPIATTPPTAIPRRLSEDIRSDTSPRSATASPTHHLMRPRSTAPGEEGAPAEEGDELRYGEMKSPARPVFDAPATGYEEILPRDPTPSPEVPQPPPAPAVSALSASGLIDPSPDNRGEALFGTSEKGAVKKTGGLFDDDDPSTTGGLFDPSPPRHVSGGSMGGSLSGRAVGMDSKVRSLFADGDEDEDPLFGGGGGRGRRELTPNEGVSLGQQSSSHSVLVALKDAAGAIEGVLSRGEVSDEAAAGDLREALVKLRSATARLR